MICPFKFTLYGFEGGQDCIGIECGMHKLCDANDAPPKGTFQVSHDCGSTFSPPAEIQGEQDSRDELEADALALVDNLRMYGGKYAGDAEVEIIALLDRQEAITLRECKRVCDACNWPEAANEQRLIAMREADENAELQAKVDELTAERGELQAKVDVLDIENGELCDEIAALNELRGELTRERDGYHEEKVRLEMELAQAQGLLSNVTHNHAAAKAKYERAQIDAKRARERQEEAERKYDELLKKPPEGAWAERVAELEAERDEFRDRLGKVLDLAGEIGGLA